MALPLFLVSARPLVSMNAFKMHSLVWKHLSTCAIAPRFAHEMVSGSFLLTQMHVLSPDFHFVEWRSALVNGEYVVPFSYQHYIMSKTACVLNAAIPSDWTDSSTPALSTSAVHDDFNHLVISTLSRHCFPLFCCSLCFHITVLLWRKNPPKIFTCIFREVFFFCSIRFGYPVGLGIWFHFSVILSSPCGITHSIATGILPLK